MDWDNKKVICAIILGIITGCILLIQDYYTIRHFNFICNSEQCKTVHTNSKGKVLLSEDIDISKVKAFELKLENRHTYRFRITHWDSFLIALPASNNATGHYIYAKCYDGSEFLLSPVYFPNLSGMHGLRRMEDFIYQLNQGLESDPVNINVSI